ncbi:MAG: TIGR03986 family CRISPR-associated RAMP protein [Candidatus Parabeggiatoa sp. nov. 3]|nr:MAG: TIGR03986 family CRISPR-associated RAMP protein [Gammaproteobacteria bacterium]RKZ58611.1 MAG: TIGR03986 family CRISPR-associated RAMP protein [Gammaproteobacteria bacterium]RKZ83387.1 MAG: TIGR03986 family CRISPR-associated RAMP protein [Gammaproteobacteria bacterium]HEW98077.1 TIGR03986 family CRISPR-associated RAMP protein [Beggiatoa sp.]
MPEEPKTSTLTIITTTKGKKNVMITVPTKKGSELRPVTEKTLTSELVPLLNKTPDDLKDIEVEYEMEKGIVRKVWKKGGEWSGEIASYASPRKPQARQDRSARNRPQGMQPRQAPFQDKEAFHNPYNFVSVLPRSKVINDLGDSEPKGHHAYHDDHWSGWLDIQLTTATPLLMPNAALVSTNEADHHTFPVRVDTNGAPYLPPTSIKGMLRSAYETVTNSRFAIFEKHNSPLAYRMDARKGIEMVPAVVENGSSKLQLRLLSNNTTIGSNGAPMNSVMYAAWLPRYQKYSSRDQHPRTDKEESKRALRYPDNTLPQHGDKVWIRCDQQQHRSGRFSFLKVTDIQQRRSGETAPSSFQAGIVCITGPNIMNKHEERVFLLTQNDPSLDLTPSLIAGWDSLIENYQHIHADELRKRKTDKRNPNDYLGHEPGKTGWSRHIDPHNQSQLKEGSLCYVRVAHADNEDYQVLGLYPVTISRDLYPEKPANLLHESLHSATDYKALSPADRVFGWVHQQGKGAWKGQLRIEPAQCEVGSQAIEHFGNDGVPLAILGEAKPQQSHFYVAHNWQGDPLPDGHDKSVGYQKRTQGLRGRKVYPHHAHLAGLHEYWVKPETDRTQKPMLYQGKKYYQEYRRPTAVEGSKNKTRDIQNRSILGWIKPETAFRFKIQISNLSSVELGALLWLLNLDKDYYHRLGSSKPLGFGSVHLQIKNMGLRKGQDWVDFYQDFLETDRQPCLCDINEAQPHIEAYKQAVFEAYGRPFGKKSFEEVSFIKAFKVALRGFRNGLPMHYPRLDEKPNPNGETFKWFVQNEKTRGPHLALPALETERGLPLLSD